jgi:antitoxin (DNA-binding transcriptional repressor) of toxin-antitoxin stability system
MDFLRGHAKTVTIEEAQQRLPELIASLLPGEEMMLTQRDAIVVKLVPVEKPKLQPRQPGSARGMLTILAEDDEHLKDFAEYMP